MKKIIPIPSLLLGLGLATASLQAETLVVFPNTSIQAKIDEASAGDIIAIFGGTYTQDVLVNKAIRLVELQGQDVTITGAITFEGVTDCPPFEGFRVGSPNKNLTVRNSSGLTISRITANEGSAVVVEGDDAQVAITSSNLRRVHQKGGDLAITESTLTYSINGGNWSNHWAFLSEPNALKTVLFRITTEGKSGLTLRGARSWVGYSRITNGSVHIAPDRNDGAGKYVLVGNEIDRRGDQMSAVQVDGRGGQVLVSNCWIHGQRADNWDADQDTIIQIRHPSHPILIMNNTLQFGAQHGDPLSPAIWVRTEGGDASNIRILNNYLTSRWDRALSSTFGALVAGNAINHGRFTTDGGVDLTNGTNIGIPGDPGFELVPDPDNPDGPGLPNVYQLTGESPLRDAGTDDPLYRDRDGSRNDIGASGGSWYDPEGWTTDKPVVISFDLSTEFALEGLDTEVTIEEAKAVGAP